MASLNGVNLRTGSRRATAISMALLLLVSSLLGMSLNTTAQPDNVFVDGYITDSVWGTPIENATIILQNQWDGTTNSSKTDVTGYYNIGIYTSMFGSDFTLSAFHDDYLVNSTNLWLFQWNNQTLNMTLDRADNKNSTVQGTVKDAITGAPMAFLGITALSQEYINITSTNAAGYYRMDLQSDLRYWIQVRSPGYEDQAREADFGWGDNKTFDFLMEPTNCTLSGYVKNATDPLGSSSVTVYRLGDPMPVEYHPQVNATTGYFEVNVSRGVWQVQVADDGHYDQTLTVIMMSGRTTWQNLTLITTPPDTATVHGYVRFYNDGSGVPFEAVSADNLNGTWNTYGFTNDTGWYSLSVIPGDIKVRAWVNDHEAREVVLSLAGGGVYDLNFSMSETAPNAFLDGYVLHNGTGKPGVRVVAYHVWRLYEAFTDPSGYYNISVPAAPLNVEALMDGYKTAFRNVSTTANTTTELNITISELLWETEMRGYVDNVPGDPVYGGYVVFDYDGMGDGSATAVTDYTGLYQTMAPGGEATYLVIAKEHEYTQGDVDMPYSQLGWLNETLTPVKENARIICRFTDMYMNKPIQHLGLSIRGQDLDWWKDVQTDAQGVVRTTVPTGFVRLAMDAWGNGYRNPGTYRDPGMLQFLIKPGEVRWFNISLFPRERTAVIHGFVNDTMANPLPGATVYVSHGDTVISDKADGTGYYELFLPDEQQVEFWARAPGKKIAWDWTWVDEEADIRYDFVLEDSTAWIEGPVTDAAVDLDGDLLFDVLYINVTVNTTSPEEFMLRGELQDGRTTGNRIASTEAATDPATGLQTVSLIFVGELIRASEKNGYFVELGLETTNTGEVLDVLDYHTSPFNHDDFDTPDATFELPVEHWLVDFDYDGLYNYLVLNITLNVSVAGDYGVMGVFRDIWGFEFANEFEMLSLDAGIHEVQLSLDGSMIYNNGENLGSCFLVLFPGVPEEGGGYIDSIFFYLPYGYDLFQRYEIDTFVSGVVTDPNDQPIPGMEVMLYNITYRFLNMTTTNDTGHFELGGWGGQWILVVDDEEASNRFQGNLSEISLVSGINKTHDVLNLPYILLDEVEQHLIFSDWNTTHLDWLLNVVGDNQTIRFMFDVMDFGDGDGFVSEEEAAFIVGFLSDMSLPSSSIDSFTVDGIWYDLDSLSQTLDAGLVGSITSDDPVYIHMTGDYTANITIPDPSPHDLALNCSYDDTSPEMVTENNATYIYHAAVPPGWGRTANGTTVNVTISGTDFITADPRGDPDKMDFDLSEWVNVTVSLGNAPTSCIIRGIVTLQGSGSHSGVVVTVYDNGTGKEVASSPTDPSGSYNIVGLSDGTYDVVAHKEGYMDNWSYNHLMAPGDTLLLDFTLYSHPPRISHTPLASAVTGVGIDIYADITDDGKVAVARLYYKDVGSPSYSYVNMTRIATTSTYAGTIPAQVQTGNVHYYIYAEDTKANFATHPALGNHTIWIYEVDPPEIFNIAVSPNPAEYPQGVNVSAEITDDHDIIIVTLFVERPDSSTSNTTMMYDNGTGRYYIDSQYTQLGTYNYTIWTNDSFGNWNSSSGTFQVLDTIPPTSSTSLPVQYWYMSPSIIIDATASDSGIGVMEVELYYRFSPDNSTWGLWTPFGADSTDPYQWDFDFPEGEGYYEFFTIATDDAWNPETMKTSAEILCGFDATPPVSFVEDILPYWYTTSQVFIDANVTELVGIDNVQLWYRYSSNNATWGNWTLYGEDSSAPYSFDFTFPHGDGYYGFFSLANDTAQNPEGMKAAAEATCGLDSSSPTSGVDVISPYWQVSSPVLVDATGSDGTSGLMDVTLWYRYSLSNSTWGPWKSYGTDNSLPYQWAFSAPDGEGYYQFHSIANDTAGNMEAVKTSFESLCGYDGTDPSSTVDAIAPYWRDTTPLTVTVSASVDVSGIVEVELWYRYSSDGSSWGGAWTSFDTDNVSPWSFSFDFPEGDGFYQFHSRATDVVGNTESAPGSEDTECAYDTQPASISGFSALPDPCELGETINISARISDVSGINGVWVDIAFETTHLGNFSMSSAGEYYWYLHTPDDTGTVGFVMWVEDGNGNWDMRSDSVDVQDTVPPSLAGLVITPAGPAVGTTVTFEVDADDLSGITSCTINISAPDGSFVLNESMDLRTGTDTFDFTSTLDDVGEYFIVIWAVDGNGLGHVITGKVTTKDTQPPQADAGPSQQVTRGTSVTLDASLSSDNYGIANYTWTFDDNGLKRLYGRITNYTFNTVKSYDITLTVRDYAGNTDTVLTWVNVTAVAGTGTITGTVLDENGDPVAGATVYVDGHQSIENTTDSWGRYTLHDVPAGDQTVIVIKDGYKRDSQDVTVQQGQSTPADDIVMAKSDKAEPTPWSLYGALAAIVAIVVVLLLFLLLGKGKKAEEIPEETKEATVIDEIFFMTNDGRLIKHFTRRLRPDMDEDILGGMLVAVQDFIKDSFRDREASLDEMKFGQFEILLGRGKHIILATILLGEEMESIRPQVARCVEDIENEFADVLEDWDGELSKVLDASKYINDLIEGKYADASE